MPTPLETALSLDNNEIGAVISVARRTQWVERFAFRIVGGAPYVNAADRLTAKGILERREAGFWGRIFADREMSTKYRLSDLGVMVQRCLR